MGFPVSYSHILWWVGTIGPNYQASKKVRSAHNMTLRIGGGDLMMFWKVKRGVQNLLTTSMSACNVLYSRRDRAFFSWLAGLFHLCLFDHGFSTWLQKSVGVSKRI